METRPTIAEVFRGQDGHAPAGELRNPQTHLGFDEVPRLWYIRLSQILGSQARRREDAMILVVRRHARVYVPGCNHQR